MASEILDRDCGAPNAGSAITRNGCQTSQCDPVDPGQEFPIGGVLGSYRLLREIGAGGMGRVFVAEHVRLGRKVALKVLRSEFSGNLEAVKRFFAEARSVNCISHENIIEVSDFIENPSGPSFYIMELLSGIDLQALQAREGVLALPRSLRIAQQICSALGAAHDAGIIHRDLKPDNIYLIERAGRRDFVKLLDFGVAKLMNATVDEEASMFHSSAGMVVGTPDYMAPEQALGHPVDHLADLYAVGVILFEMVAGRRPFVANTAREVMVQHLTAAPPRPSQLNPAHEIPYALEDLILASLHKEPAQRPPNIREVEQRLGAILDALPPAAGHRAARAQRRRRRRPWSMILVACTALLLATAGGFAWVGGGGRDSAAALLTSGARLVSRSGGRADPSKLVRPARAKLTIVAAAPDPPEPPPPPKKAIRIRAAAVVPTSPPLPSTSPPRRRPPLTDPSVRGARPGGAGVTP